jgi:hypothetical protein
MATPDGGLLLEEVHPMGDVGPGGTGATSGELALGVSGAPSDRPVADVGSLPAAVVVGMAPAWGEFRIPSVAVDPRAASRCVISMRTRADDETP